MGIFYQTIKGDYLQRSRSYAFLITLAITIYAAYHFVPAPDENYTTLIITGYKGVYNSAWAGHISVLMTTIILALFGFFLVNGAIKKDIDTEVGLIVAASPISNMRYLLIKFVSNLLILLTISALAIIVAMLVFLIKKSGYPFLIKDFLLPYIFTIIPAMTVVAGFAILGEVFLRGKGILQGILYFFIFTTLITINMGSTSSSAITDVFGINEIISSITNQIDTQFHERIKDIALGYTITETASYKTFVWNGVSWSFDYLTSRAVWIGMILISVCISSFSFHRFDFKTLKIRRLPIFPVPAKTNYSKIEKIALPAIIPAYGILPLIKIELLLMIRKDPKILNILSFALWVSLLFVPLTTAHVILLPVLFFLQVNKLSDLATKEKAYRLHYLTYAAYKPLQRVLSAQILAAFSLLIALAFPVILRLIIGSSYLNVIQVVNGTLLIAILSISIGIISDGKKLFEVFFFLLTYCVLKRISAVDYLGGIPHPDYLGKMLSIFIINISLLVACVMFRARQVNNL